MMPPNTRLKQSLTAAGILLLVIVATKALSAIPWWSFVISVMLLGMVLKWARYDIPYFMIGFVTGFLLWLGANAYFDMTMPGLVFEKLGKILSVPKIAIMVISGVMGGLLSGLAFYTGKQLFLNGPAPEGDADQQVW
jgi:hypothetical protein